MEAARCTSSWAFRVGCRCTGTGDFITCSATRSASCSYLSPTGPTVNLGCTVSLDWVGGTKDDFDAILFSANSGAGTPAKAGYPSITVPGGFVAPAAPIEQPFPSGVTFSGPAFSEPTLIALAYAFEQATGYRVPPASTPPLPSDSVERP